MGKGKKNNIISESPSRAGGKWRTELIQNLYKEKVVQNVE